MQPHWIQQQQRSTHIYAHKSTYTPTNHTYELTYVRVHTYIYKLMLKNQKQKEIPKKKNQKKNALS